MRLGEWSQQCVTPLAWFLNSSFGLKDDRILRPQSINLILLKIHNKRLWCCEGGWTGGGRLIHQRERWVHNLLDRHRDELSTNSLLGDIRGDGLCIHTHTHTAETQKIGCSVDGIWVNTRYHTMPQLMHHTTCTVSQQQLHFKFSKLIQPGSTRRNPP